MAGFFESSWGRFFFFVVIPRACLLANQGRHYDKDNPAPASKSRLGAVLVAIILELHIPRQTRVGHLKRQPTAGFFESPWGRFFRCHPQVTYL